MQFPVLSIIVFTPAVAGLIILLIPSHRKTEVRMAALAAAIFALSLSFWVYLNYDQARAGYQFIERYQWLPQMGISLQFGVDGISTPLVLLTGLVMFTGVLISWGLDDRPREFFAFLFILASGVFGVFVALDLFMLFFFYEIAVFPMYLLICHLGVGQDPRICCHETDPLPVYWIGGRTCWSIDHVLGGRQIDRRIHVRYVIDIESAAGRSF